MYKKKYAKYLLKINFITGGMKYRHDPYSPTGYFIYNDEQIPEQPAQIPATIERKPWRSQRVTDLTAQREAPQLEIYFCKLSNIELNKGDNSGVKLLFCTNFPNYHITYYIKCNSSLLDGYHITDRNDNRYGNVDGKMIYPPDRTMKYIYYEAQNNKVFSEIVQIARRICELAELISRTEPKSLSSTQIRYIKNGIRTTENRALLELAGLIRELENRAENNADRCHCF